MDTPLAWLSDQQLIALARKAGLCFPDCWHLDEDIDPAAQQANRQWVDAAEDGDTRERREQILEIGVSSRHERLKQLRTFAQLLNNAPRDPSTPAA